MPFILQRFTLSKTLANGTPLPLLSNLPSQSTILTLTHPPAPLLLSNPSHLAQARHLRWYESPLLGRRRPLVEPTTRRRPMATSPRAGAGVLNPIEEERVGARLASRPFRRRVWCCRENSERWPSGGTRPFFPFGPACSPSVWI
jgi:hypothetical protein